MDATASELARAGWDMESLLRCLEDEDELYASLAQAPAPARPRSDDGAEQVARPLNVTPCTDSRQRRRARRTSPSPLGELAPAAINCALSSHSAAGTSTTPAARPLAARCDAAVSARKVEPSPAKAAVLAQLHDEFSCSVCHDLCVRPHTTNCGHSFCALCVRRSVARCGAFCPLCRRELPDEPGNSLAVNSAMWSAIQYLFARELRELECEHAREEQADADAQRAAEAARVAAQEAEAARAASGVLTAAEEWAARRARRAAAQSAARATLSAGAASQALAGPEAGSAGEEGEAAAASPSDAASPPEQGGLGAHNQHGFFTANEVWQMQQSHPSATPSRIYSMGRSEEALAAEAGARHSLMPAAPADRHYPPAHVGRAREAGEPGPE